MTTSNRGYTLSNGSPVTSFVYQEVFKWTTGTVAVTALEGTFPTILERKGYDRAVTAELLAKLGDVRVIEGNGTTGTALRNAGIERAELVSDARSSMERMISIVERS